MEQNRFIQINKKKKGSKKTYSTNFSSSQKVSFIFKISPPVYLPIIKTDIK